MKKLLLASLLSLSFVAQAQPNWRSPLPLDSATQRIAYSGVVEVAGASKVELSSRAHEWFTSRLGQQPATDQETGELAGMIGSPAIIDFGGKIARSPITIWRTVRIESQDGTYRYSFTDFVTGASSGHPAALSPAEFWLKLNRVYFDKRGNPQSAARSLTAAIQDSSQQLAASLKTAMSAAAKP